MRDALNKLREFQAKHGFEETKLDQHRVDVIEKIGQTLINCSAELEKLDEFKTDPKLLRAHLMCEELGETLIAMSKGEVVDFLDGLADLIYVVLGTATTFGMPLAEAFDEVHASNMTKDRVLESDTRIRTKGPLYMPPDLKRILQERGMLEDVYKAAKS